MYETHSSSLAAETVTGPIVFVHGSLRAATCGRRIRPPSAAARQARSTFRDMTSPAAALLVSEALVRAAPRAFALTVPGAGHMLPVTHAPALTAILRARFPGRDDDIPRAA